MKYKHAIEPKYYFDEPFDELPEVSQEALYAAAAADKLNDVFRWQIGKNRGHPEYKRQAALARLYVLGVILGQWTQAEAAKKAGVSIKAMERAKRSFCDVFNVEKQRQNVVKRKAH